MPRVLRIKMLLEFCCGWLVFAQIALRTQPALFSLYFCLENGHSRLNIGGGGLGGYRDFPLPQWAFAPRQSESTGAAVNISKPEERGNYLPWWAYSQNVEAFFLITALLIFTDSNVYFSRWHLWIHCFFFLLDFLSIFSIKLFGHF